MGTTFTSGFHDTIRYNCWSLHDDGQSTSSFPKMSLMGGRYVNPDFKRYCEIATRNNQSKRVQLPFFEFETNLIYALKLKIKYLQNPTTRYTGLFQIIVVEVGHARVITFLPLSCELSVLSLSLSFFR
jgi:hypothetical protein